MQEKANLAGQRQAAMIQAGGDVLPGIMNPRELYEQRGQRIDEIGLAGGFSANREENRRFRWMALAQSEEQLNQTLAACPVDG